MSRKRIIILLVAALVVAGGIWGVKTYLDIQAHNAYLASPDRIADQLLGDLTAGNYQDAHARLFSDRMKNNYPLDYWKSTDQTFSLLKGYKETPVRSSKQLANDANPAEPKPYTDDVRAQQYTYDFRVDDLTYRVTFVVIMLQGSWQVNELTGAYQR